MIFACSDHRSVPAFVFLFFFFIWEGGGIRHVAHPLGTLRFISSTVAGPWEWIGHGVGPLILLTFTEILRVVKGRRWSICWLEGNEVSTPAQGFWSEYETCFPLFRRNGPVSAATVETRLSFFKIFPRLSRKWRCFLGAWGAALHSFYRSTLERCKAVHRWQSAGPGKNADQLTVTYTQKRSEKVVRIICWTEQWLQLHPVCLDCFFVHFKVVKYGGGTEIEEIPGPSGWCSCSV